MGGARSKVYLLLLFGLVGCVTPPKIDTASFPAPKSVVIVDIPKMSNVALIGVVVPWAPGFPQFHFSERADRFFDVPGQSPASSNAASANAGVIGSVIESKAAATQKKSAEEFSAEVLKRFPDFDLRADFIKSLRASLEGRGIAVKMLSDRPDQAPRLRWPASDKEGNTYPAGSLENSPPVDADVLVQVSPIAIYNSPGPLNAYKRNVSVGLALYNGRTRQFIGRQTVRFNAPDSRFQYHQYDALVQDLSQAAPALRDALVSLVPEVADIISGRR